MRLASNPLILPIWLAVTAPIGAQSVTISSNVSCAKCVINAEKTATIGEGGSYELAKRPMGMTRDLSGHLWVIEQGHPQPVLLSASGSKIREVGRPGAGPGEFQRIGVIIPAHDGTVHVFDASLSRRTILTSEGKVLGITPLYGVGPSIGSAIVLPNGHIVTSRPLTNADGVGYQFQESDSAGKLIRQFGGDGNFRVDRPAENMRRLGAAKGNEFWSASVFAYQLELYGGDGKLKKRIVRNADWFPPLQPGVEPEGGRRNLPPTPLLIGAWQDSKGLLWIVASIKSDQWKAGPPIDPRNPNAGLAAPQRVHQTVIEVIDPVAGKLLASKRFGFAPQWVLRNGYIASFREGEDGTPIVDVWHLTFTN